VSLALITQQSQGAVWDRHTNTTTHYHTLCCLRQSNLPIVTSTRFILIWDEIMWLKPRQNSMDWAVTLRVAMTHCDKDKTQDRWQSVFSRRLTDGLTNVLQPHHTVYGDLAPPVYLTARAQPSTCHHVHCWLSVVVSVTLLSIHCPQLVSWSEKQSSWQSNNCVSYYSLWINKLQINRMWGQKINDSHSICMYWNIYSVSGSP